MRALRFVRTGRGVVGLAILGFVVAVALFGPFFAPHHPSDILGAPGSPPSGSFPLGTDYLGHDVLSRVLWGGRSVLWLSLAATTLSFALGMAIGGIAGYSRSIVDPVLMRLVDVVLSFPPLLLFILVVTSVGNSYPMIIVTIAVILAPGIARIVYSATREASVRGYTEAAITRGERTGAILLREILPNILGPVIANLGLTVTFSVLLVGSGNLPGLRRAAAQRQLGADDLREPRLPVAQRLGDGGAGGADRAADDRGEHGRRRDLAHPGPHRPPVRDPDRRHRGDVTPAELI